MPVIGRLDGQVDEVIISPISRGRSEPEPPPPTNNEETPEHAPSNTPPAVESSADDGELPVWLL